jgi:autophagy-related ATG5-like protein
MGQLKEADFLRWGNTKRMTGLRKAEQDGMWEGIKERLSILVFRSPTLAKAECGSAEREALQITLMTTGA